ncbi:MAG: metallophosphoesterase [Polyangiaceae bacterium]
MNENEPAPRDSPDPPIRIAVVGDIHAFWGPPDVEYFNQSDYDLVLFVGDLGGYTVGGTLKVARSIARLEKPALVLPGNHDAITPAQLAAEISGVGSLIELASGGEERRRRELAEALGPVPLVGYSLHRFRFRTQTLSIVAARPHSFGGPRLAFRPLMKRAFGVTSLEESETRLKQLVDDASNELLFLAHNGPTGLGEARESIWGCDFRRNAGDFGDPDLRGALTYATSQGKRVRAVLAGHMHHALKGGGDRTWLEEAAGTYYVNAARVPRVFRMAKPGSEAPAPAPEGAKQTPRPPEGTRQTLRPPDLKEAAEWAARKVGVRSRVRHHVRVELRGDETRVEARLCPA